MAWRSSTVRLSLFALVLLSGGAGGSGGMWKPVMAGAVTKTGAGAAIETPPPPTTCVVLLDNAQVRKSIGSEWLSPDDPCTVHACRENASGWPQVTVSRHQCEQFYCDVDSELRTSPDSCCGRCVRTKCRYRDDVYAVGQFWHNAADCTVLECTQLADGQPMINTFQRDCAPLPTDCAPERIYMADCCAHCNTTGAAAEAPRPAQPRNVDDGEPADIWTEAFYRNHSCARECHAGEPPQTCHYKFVVEWYQTLSKACYDCPRNGSDCTRPHCIFTDGISRSITVVNRMMPGPSIEVCENDTVVVDVENELLGESTTIHWHGLHQRDTPYMDGVPHVSQCPVSPHATFRYRFRADRAGTHFWHSHTGMQRGDGVFGAFIVRRPRLTDPHGHLYDFDLAEHKMIVQDWVHMPGISMFADHHHSRGDNKPRTLLVNGRGRFYHGIWEAIKGQRADGQPTTTTASTERTPDVDLLHPAGAAGRLETNEISRLARLATQDNRSAAAPSTTTAAPETTTTVTEDAFTTDYPGAAAAVEPSWVPRTKRAANDADIPLDEMPLQVYNVQRGYRYRFRIINAEFLNCPIAVSVDNHSLTAIASDGYDFEAVEVGSIVTYAGERFDFVLHADQTPGNYWVRFKGLMDCSEKFTSAFQVAILRYAGAAVDAEPSAQPGYAYTPDGIELNVMNRGPGHVESLTVAELTALPLYDAVAGVDRDALKPQADYKFFVYYDFYVKDNPVFHPSELYGVNANLTAANRLFTPQLNHISLKMPAGALLPGRDQIDDALFCNETSLAAAGIDCRKQFCKCHHVLQVPLGAVVELIIVDEGFTFDANHPFHLHGNAFRVIALERLGANVTIEMVKQLDSMNQLKRNLARPPIKDTVTVPDGGYTIVRFKADNPGFWLFHCHIEFHAEIGMALILKVGNNDEMLPAPPNFPTCHDYMPARGDSGEESAAPNATSAPQRPPPGENGGAAAQAALQLTMLLMLLLALSLVR